MTLGQRIRAARGTRGAPGYLTQAELARRIGEIDSRLRSTEGKHIGKWERDGAPRLAFYVIDAIAQATGRPLDDFSLLRDAAERSAAAQVAAGRAVRRTKGAGGTR